MQAAGRSWSYHLHTGKLESSLAPPGWCCRWYFFKLYVDGKLVETKKGEPRNPKGETGTANYSGSLWNIGRNAGATDRVFRGYIDDVMIFKTALTQQQIANIMLHNF